MRGGFPKQEDALRVRTPVAAGDLRKDHEKAAERKERREPERGVEAHKLARWWEAPDEKNHHRRREGCCDLARTQAPPTPRGTRRDPPRRRYARAPAERRAQRATDNRADEHDVILAEQRREASPSRAEKRLPARRYAHTRIMKPRIERQLEAGFSHPKDDSAPSFCALGPRRRPSKRRRKTMSRKPRYASFAPALGPGEQVKSSSTCTSTPPFAVIGAPIAAKQPSTHAFNSSNCSPSLM